MYTYINTIYIYKTSLYSGAFSCSAHKLWNSFPQEVRNSKIVNEYDQEIPQSQTADNPVAPRGRAAQPSQDIRQTN